MWWLIASGVVAVLWWTGAVRIFPINLFTQDAETYHKGDPRRHWIRRQGRLWRGVYWEWQPVREIIPLILYIARGQPFYLDDYGFKRGAR